MAAVRRRCTVGLDPGVGLRPAPGFTLTAAGNRPVSLADSRGKAVLLYFGHPPCPDLGPTTLSNVKNALAQLGAQADQVQFLMVTVGPERATPEVLATFLAFFDARFIGLTGTLDQIGPVARSYGIGFSKEPGDAATGYLVDHTASWALTDRQGVWRKIFDFGTGGPDLAADLRYVLAR